MYILYMTCTKSKFYTTHAVHTHKPMVHMYILLLPPSPPLPLSPSHTHRVLEEVLQRGGDFRDEGMGTDLLAEL